MNPTGVSQSDAKRKTASGKTINTTATDAGVAPKSENEAMANQRAKSTHDYNIKVQDDTTAGERRRKQKEDAATAMAKRLPANSRHAKVLTANNDMADNSASSKRVIKRPKA